MFSVGEYVVYKKDVCKIVDIKENGLNNLNYYILVPINDSSLKISVPTDNKCGFLRNLITKKQVNEIIENIPNIGIVENNDRMIETEYRKLLNSNKHDDLIKIIKTTYLRNKERIDNNKKTRDSDNTYFAQAETYLYNEFSIVLGLTYEETKNYVVKQVTELTINNS